jgi:hypothetical protein
MARKAKDKEDRMAETRESEQRDAIFKAIDDMEHRTPLYIDPDMIPPGFEYAWILHSVHGEVMPKWVIDARKRGFVEVPASRHADMVFQAAPGTNPGISGCIWVDGSILMERRLEYKEREDAVKARRNRDILSSMQGIDSYVSDPRMPLHNRSEAFQFREGMGKDASFGL